MAIASSIDQKDVHRRERQDFPKDRVDEGVTHSICAHLEGNHYEARPFLKSSDLLATLRSQHFDGFVIDWIVGATSTLMVMASTWAQTPSARSSF